MVNITISGEAARLLHYHNLPTLNRPSLFNQSTLRVVPGITGRTIRILIMGLTQFWQGNGAPPGGGPTRLAEKLPHLDLLDPPLRHRLWLAYGADEIARHGGCAVRVAVVAGGQP